MKYLYYFRLSFSESVAYRFSMLLSLIVAPLTVIIQFFVWRALLSTQERIVGFTLDSIVIYFILASLLQYFVYTEVIDLYKEYFVKGTLTRDLLRPVSLFPLYLFWSMGGRFLAILIEILPLVLASGFLLGFGALVPAQSLLFFLSLPIAYLLYFSLAFLLAQTGFWSNQLHGMKMVFFMIFLMGTGFAFPLSILPEFLQLISLYLPFQHVIFAPAMYFIGDFSLAGSSAAWMNLLRGIIWVFILILLALYVQRRGLNRYQGVGQ